MAVDWQPLSGHISQLRKNPDGSYAGDEDCGPASSIRYLREAGKLPCTVPVLDQLNAWREFVDHAPDVEGQAGTIVSDVERYLAHVGVESTWTQSFDAAEASPFAICLITSAARLQDGSFPYPESWLAGQEHWVLWLRQWKGSYSWFDDPLTYDGGERDTQLDLGYLRQIFAGAILLPDVPTAPKAPRKVTVAQKVGLKVQPNHQCSALCQIPAGALALDMGQRAVTAGEQWARLDYSGRIGWVPAAAQ